MQVAQKDIQFLLANGQTITRDIGYAISRVDEFETVDEVVLGKESDLKLLGARAGRVCDASRSSRQEAGCGRTDSGDVENWIVC